MINLIGQSLGRYHILEQVGEGGMAVVYKAYDTRLERDVAVKVLRTDQFAPSMLERIQKRFEREAKALGKLSHPNIVNVHDFGEHEGQPFLVMEYLPGGTLKDRLGKPMPWLEACRILLPISEALSYAHEHGILHRDVKPSNILLAERGQPLLTDFGIAKILDLEGGETLTGTGVGIGTPEYMSPEQGLGKPVNAATDVYSLGVVFYELVTGRKPYTADTPMAVVVKHLNDPLPRPVEFVPNLPVAVENVLLKALAKKPEERYQNMAEFSAALEKLIASEQGAGTATLKAVTGRFEEKTAEPARRMDTQSTMDQGLTTEEGIQKAAGGQAPPSRPAAVRQPPPQKPRKVAWLAWVAGLGVVAVFICLILVLIFLGGDIKATFFPTQTPTFTPTPTIVNVAIFDYDTDSGISYWSGGIGNTWDLYAGILNSDPAGRFTVSTIQSLDRSTLAGYSRLILPDNAIPDSYLSSVSDWLQGGNNSLIAVDSAITYVSYAGWMWSGSAGIHGEDVFWDYNSTGSDLTLMSGALTIKFFSSSLLSSNVGDAQMFMDLLPSDAVVLAVSGTDPSKVYAACRNIPGGGRVFVLGPFDTPEDDLAPMIREVVYAMNCE